MTEHSSSFNFRMSLTFYFWLLLASGNDLIALFFNISLNAMTWIGRIGLLVLPPLAYLATYRACIGLQRADFVGAAVRLKTSFKVQKFNVQSGDRQNTLNFEP